MNYLYIKIVIIINCYIYSYTMNNKPCLECQEKASPQKVSTNQNFDIKFKAMKQCDKTSFVIIADYDETFTKKMIGKNRSRSSFGVIDQSSLISKEFHTNSANLSAKYRKYESDLTVDFETRDKIVKEWYMSDLQLMIDEKLNKLNVKSFIEEAINQGYFLFRNGIYKFFDLLEKYNLPLILISAGIKGVIIGELKALLGNDRYQQLKAKKLLTIIANEFIYDDKDKIVDYGRPVIYSFNKSSFVTNKLVNDRKDINILFFGDNFNDIDAISKMEYSNVLGIAFGNYPEKDIPKEYYEKYDAVVKEDGDLWFINDTIEKLYN